MKELHVRARGNQRGEVSALVKRMVQQRGKIADSEIVSDYSKHSEGSRGTVMEIIVATEGFSKEVFSTEEGRRSRVSPPSCPLFFHVHRLDDTK